MRNVCPTMRERMHPHGATAARLSQRQTFCRGAARQIVPLGGGGLPLKAESCRHSHTSRRELPREEPPDPRRRKSHTGAA